MMQRLYIEEAVRDDPLALAIRRRFSATPVSVVPTEAAVHEAIARAKDPKARGKRVLFLRQNLGSFIKPCPGTKSYICCGYRILHVGTYCTMDCTYCILQAYFHPPVLQFFVNQKAMFQELDELLGREDPGFHRIGTGEFTDSLIWEPWTGLSRTLISYFARQNRLVLELKTKTCAVDNLKGLSHNQKTIVAWSLNPPSVIEKEERGTASLKARLQSAARCEAWGYPLAFHFDPLVLYEGWEEDYRRLIRRLFRAVSAEHIVWISLGSFRFMPSLKPIIQKRFPGSKIIYGEFIRGLDNKLRYFKPLRIELYKKVAGWIRELAPDVVIYFCMEDEEVWEKALGFVPQQKGGLARMLDRSAARHCGCAVGH